jgi:hypothetical protein
VQRAVPVVHFGEIFAVVSRLVLGRHHTRVLLQPLEQVPRVR